MKFSEAVRAGKKWPDSVLVYESGECCCAIGGAIRAMLGKESVERIEERNWQSYITFCEGLWPELSKIELPCPVQGCNGCVGVFSNEPLFAGTGTPFKVASHLFSDHRYSKDAVAIWVEELVEKKLEATVAKTCHVRSPRIDAPVA